MTSVQKDERSGYKMYKNSDIKAFGKKCAEVEKSFIDSIYMAEKIYYSEIGKEILREIGRDEELLIAISRQFAKYEDKRKKFDMNGWEVQLIQNMVELIVKCCEIYNWFHEKR